VEEDHILLSRARGLDQEAIAEIHDAHYVSIYRYISFRVDDVLTVEDLTSDVFIRFLSALRDRHAPPNTIRGWLIGTASNVIKEHYRAKKRLQQRETALNESLPEEGPDPAQSVSIKLTNEQLRQAMEDLPEGQQKVLALRFGYGMRHKEVADTLDKSEGSVKMLQVRAIAALARKLSGLELHR
jgi:RNA polymerase sigma-70 factor (ECF subfamily)